MEVTAMTNRLTTLAAETVAVYRSDFPGLAPDWSSDWWSTAWEIDDCPGTFATYLRACQRAWQTDA